MRPRTTYNPRIVAADDASDGLESGRGAIRASGSLGAAVRAVSQLKSAMLQQKPQMLLLDYPHSLLDGRGTPVP